MGRREYYEEQKIKRIASMFSITLVLAVVIFLTVFVMYNKKLKAESNSNMESLGKLNEIVSNENLTETSFSTDKTVSNTVENATNVNNVNNTTKKTSKKSVATTPVDSKVENTLAENSNTVSEEKVEEKKELSFMAPVSGEITKDFATDTLVYSNTLEEWTTHTGIDIKADKTTVVMAAEEGTVESIKNDPRYGLTVTISHENGFKTIYSNLLTTEFVTENETVEKGQTIGTVGESSSFEIADEPHLHFEMYKDGEIVNPTIYLQ